MFLAITLLGYVSYKQLKVELLPNAELPMLYVQVNARAEVDPAYMESQAVMYLEGVISTMGGVEEIISTVNTRNASISVSFKQNINFNYTYLKLQERIKEAAVRLPAEFSVNVSRGNVTSMTSNFMELQVRGSGGVDRVRSIVDDKILADLQNVEGVASVSVFGGRQRTIEVQMNREVCNALNITPSRLQNLITQNSQGRTFVGSVDQNFQQYFVYVNTEYSHVTDIESIVVAPGPILLKDVAKVFFDVKDETTISRVNGLDAVSVSLINDAQVNMIDLSKRVLTTIDKLNKQLKPQDVELVVQSNSAQIIEDNIGQIIQMALIGGLLAIFVLWIFLRNVRLVVLIAVSVPISICAAYNFFYGFGITINSLTLVGMTLAVGMLLDSSVVVLENIYRLSAGGMPPAQAVMQGTKEVWRSIVTATLTTVVVFMPFIFSDNYLIELLGMQIGVSIISTLMIALAVALLFTPMMTHVFLQQKNDKTIFYQTISIRQRLIQKYLVVLKACMRKPALIILGAVAALIITVLLSLSINIASMREVNADRFNVYINLAQGTTLEATDQVVQSLEESIKPIEEIQDVVARIQEQTAVLTIILKKDFEKIAKRSVTSVKTDVENRTKAVSSADISLSQAMAGGGAGGVSSGSINFMRLLGIGDNRERVVLKGRDFELMQTVAEDIRYYLGELQSIERTQISSTGNRPEVQLTFDQELLTQYNISQSNLASDLGSFNNVTSSGARLKLGLDEYDILIRQYLDSEEEAQVRQQTRTLNDLKSMMIHNATGGGYELQSIAGVNLGSGKASIRRVNQEKQIEIFYSFPAETQQSKELLESYRLEVDQLIARYQLPAGMAVEVIHEEDQFGDFKLFILIAFLLIYMIMASVFESFFTPFVLMFSIPLAAIGALVALVITGNSLLNANTLTGFIILLGVVVNNGIILIDYSNILIERGYRRTRALMTSGLSRLRPILITSITTIVAMFPMAMGNNEYAGAIGSPFAVTVIGGLSFSGLLTLIFIPTVYLSMENALVWYQGLSRRIHLLHTVIFLAGVYFIFTGVDGVLSQTGYVLLLAILIPSITFFITSSLRHADSSLIPENEPIRITISNLVKIYDRSGSFMREWSAGRILRERLGLEKEYRTLRDFAQFIWQVPLLMFLIYFSYIFLSNKFWTFVLSFGVFLFVLALWKMIRSYLQFKFPSARFFGKIYKLLYWGVPFVIFLVIFSKWDNPGMSMLVGVFWLLLLAVYATSDYLYRNEINVDRIEGRFSGLRRGLARIVKSIPVVGKRRRPFKALKGVSFEISTGMIGLLGPNGAGKSTFMRIICGILNQSYGKIWINGYDTQEYREELQDLIGFLPQEFGMYEQMSAEQFLDFMAILKGISDKKIRSERIQYVLGSVHMLEKKDHKISSFSGGMKQRIGIALILLHLPRILVVDEPTAGLDPRERIRFRNLLVELSRDRIVIFSTHIIEDIASSCNQVVVINKGDRKYFGNPRDMVRLAEGKVWLYTLNMDEFEELPDKSLVVHHVQEGNQIRIRFISPTKPSPDALSVEPNLEDAYLCLLKNI